MSWLTIGAIAATAILFVNSGVYFIRLRRLRKLGISTSPLWRARVKGKTLVITVLMVCAFIAGPIVSIIAPSSTFAIWLRADYSLIVYWVYCMVFFIILEILLAWHGLRIRKNDGAT